MRGSGGKGLKRTWQIREGGFREDRGCTGWFDGLGDIGQASEGVAGYGRAEECGRHVC